MDDQDWDCEKRDATIAEQRADIEALHELLRVVMLDYAVAATCIKDADTGRLWHTHDEKYQEMRERYRAESEGE
jgi:hypothetical protein